MAEQYALEYTLSRDDWLAANRALIATSAQYEVYAKQKQRAGIKQMLYVGPLVVVGASLGIGSMASTHGMYLEGALAGLVLVTLMCMGFCRRSTYLEQARRQAEDRVRRMEIGEGAGRIAIRFDASGATVRTASSNTHTSWKATVVHPAGEYFVVSRGGPQGMIVPKSALGTESEAAEFARQCTEWWQIGQQNPAERVAAYLADRDVSCPKCSYNLRGTIGAKCPECGMELSVAALSKAKQS